MPTETSKQAPVHLYRGAPPVRSWSRYKITLTKITLCGVNEPQFATEDAIEVSCVYCKHLMRQHSIHAEEPSLPREEAESPLHIR